MDRRVRIKWTVTARDQLASLPRKVRRGILSKADMLLECENPRTLFKALLGSLKGYFRIPYSRYRAIYSVVDEDLASGDILTTVTVCFVTVGKRKAGDKRDVYRLAERLIKLGMLADKDEDTAEDGEVSDD